MSLKEEARFQRGMSLEAGRRGRNGGPKGRARAVGASIIEAMVIDMKEAKVRTLEQVRQVVAGTQALEFRRAEDDEGRYCWIGSVLGRFGYRQLGRADKGAVLAYLQHLSGYSRAQVTRLVARWVQAKPLQKNYRRPEHAFARRYTPADVALLASVDRAMGTLSGRPRCACCAASAMCSRCLASSGWATFRWRTCTTCAAAQATGISAW